MNQSVKDKNAMKWKKQNKKQYTGKASTLHDFSFHNENGECLIISYATIISINIIFIISCNSFLINDSLINYNRIPFKYIIILDRSTVAIKLINEDNEAELENGN